MDRPSSPRGRSRHRSYHRSSPNDSRDAPTTPNQTEIRSPRSTDLSPTYPRYPIDDYTRSRYNSSRRYDDRSYRRSPQESPPPYSRYREDRAYKRSLNDSPPKRYNERISRRRLDESPPFSHRRDDRNYKRVLRTPSSSPNWLNDQSSRRPIDDSPYIPHRRRERSSPRRSFDDDPPYTYRRNDRRSRPENQNSSYYRHNDRERYRNSPSNRSPLPRNREAQERYNIHNRSCDKSPAPDSNHKNSNSRSEKYSNPSKNQPVPSSPRRSDDKTVPRRDRSPSIPRTRNKPNLSYPLSKQLSPCQNEGLQPKKETPKRVNEPSKKANQFHLILNDPRYKEAIDQLEKTAPSLLDKFPPLYSFNKILDSIVEIFVSRLESEKMQLIEDHCQKGGKNPFLQRKKRLRSPERKNNSPSHNPSPSTRRRLRSSRDSDDDDDFMPERNRKSLDRGKQIRSNLNEDVVFNEMANKMDCIPSPKRRENIIRLKLKKEEILSDSDSESEFKLCVVRPILPCRGRSLASDYTSLTPYISDSDDDTDTEELRKANARKPLKLIADQSDEEEVESATRTTHYYTKNGKSHFLLPFPYRRMRRDALVVCPPEARTSDGLIPPLQWPNDVGQANIVQPAILSIPLMRHVHYIEKSGVPPIAVPKQPPISVQPTIPEIHSQNQQRVMKPAVQRNPKPNQRTNMSNQQPNLLRELDKIIAFNKSLAGTAPNVPNTRTTPQRIISSSQNTHQHKSNAYLGQNFPSTHNIGLQGANRNIPVQRQYERVPTNQIMHSTVNRVSRNQNIQGNAMNVVHANQVQLRNQNIAQSGNVNNVVYRNGLVHTSDQHGLVNASLSNENIQYQPVSSRVVQTMKASVAVGNPGHSSSELRQYCPQPNQIFDNNVQQQLISSQIGTQSLPNQFYSTNAQVPQTQQRSNDLGAFSNQAHHKNTSAMCPSQIPSTLITGVNGHNTFPSNVARNNQMINQSRSAPMIGNRGTASYTVPQSDSDIEILDLINEGMNPNMMANQGASRITSSNQVLQSNQGNFMNGMTSNGNVNISRSYSNSNVAFAKANGVNVNPVQANTGSMGHGMTSNGVGVSIQTRLPNNTNPRMTMRQDSNGVIEANTMRGSQDDLVMEFNKQYQLQLTLQMQEASRHMKR